MNLHNRYRYCSYFIIERWNHRNIEKAPFFEHEITLLIKKGVKPLELHTFFMNTYR